MVWLHVPLSLPMPIRGVSGSWSAFERCKVGRKSLPDLSIQNLGSVFVTGQWPLHTALGDKAQASTVFMVLYS